MLRVFLFGAVRVSVNDGAPEPVSGERSQRLLAALVLPSGDRSPRNRETLKQRLGWSDDNLRGAVAELKSLCPEVYAGYLTRQRGRLSLEGELSADVWDFDGLWRDHPSEAVKLATGPVLESVMRSALSGWEEARRKEYSGKLFEALGAVGEEEAVARRWGDAARAARAQLELSPFNEPATRSLMRYLALGGEPREALEVYRAFSGARGTAAETDELRRQIAEGDLAKPPRAVEASQAGPAADFRQSSHRSRRRRGLAIAAVAATVGALAALVGFAAGDSPNEGASGDASCPPSRSEPSGADRQVIAAGRPSGRPRAEKAVAVGTRPAAVAVASEGVWIAQRQGLALIDPGTRRQIGGFIPTGGNGPDAAPFAIAVAEDRLWVTRRDGLLVAIDRDTRELTGRPVRYGKGAADVAVGGGAVWVNNFEDGFDGNVTRVDPCSRRISRIPVGREADAVEYGFGSLWVSNAADGLVARVDPRRRRKVASVSGFDDPQDIAVTGDSVWVVQYGPQLLGRIDPRTGRRDRRDVRIGPDPAAVAAGLGALWVPLYGNGTVTRVDITTRRSFIGKRKAGQSPTDAAVGFGRVWIPNNNGDSVSSIRP